MFNDDHGYAESADHLQQKGAETDTGGQASRTMTGWSQVTNDKVLVHYLRSLLNHISCFKLDLVCCVWRLHKSRTHLGLWRVTELWKYTWSRLVIDPSNMPKNNTPISSMNSSVARSAFLIGVTSPNPIVVIVVNAQ